LFQLINLIKQYLHNSARIRPDCR